MKFSEFLTERHDFTLEEALKLISKDCGDFLSKSGFLPMFRGIPRTSINRDFTVEIPMDVGRFSPHPVNRPPKDSDPAFNFMFNAGIELAFGIESVRTNSFFCTGSSSLASRFGTPHYVFPVGNISYLWSDKFEDSYEDSSKILDSVGKFARTPPTFLPKFERIVGILFEELSLKMRATQWLNSDYDYLTKELLAPIIEDFHLSETFWKNDNVCETIKKSLTRAFKECYNNNTQLKTALGSEHEIAIYKSGGYYTLPVNLVYQEYKNNSSVRSLYDVENLYKVLLHNL
jgi:hypothetical protein